MASAFFQEQREWSSRKHGILARYLKPFCQALSGQAQQGAIYYIDCFAGAGAYKLEDGSSVDGSPVLAAKIALSLPYTIKCLNVESDPQNFASLEENTRAYKGVVINFQGNIEQHLGAILQSIGNSPALFFLDPFGIKDIPITGLMDAIAQRRAITDALIRYDPTIVRRLCGRALQDPKRGPKDAANLTRIFAGDEWKKVASTASALDDQLLALYASKLLHLQGSRFKFVASYPLRTLEEKLKYYLLFATGNRLGVKMMSEILYAVEEEFLDKKAAQTTVHQLSLFGEPSAEQLLALKIENITASIRQIGISQASWTYERLYYELILQQGWFGRISDKLFRQVCKKLAEEGMLSKGQGAWGRDTLLLIKS